MRASYYIALLLRLLRPAINPRIAICLFAQKDVASCGKKSHDVGLFSADKLLVADVLPAADVRYLPRKVTTGVCRKVIALAIIARWTHQVT